MGGQRSMAVNKDAIAMEIGPAQNTTTQDLEPVGWRVGAVKWNWRSATTLLTTSVSCPDISESFPQ